MRAAPAARLLRLLPVVALAACGADPHRLKSGPATQPAALTICPASTGVQGVDVSYYQGTIDWGQVAGAGIAFGIARINDGTYLDPQFQPN